MRGCAHFLLGEMCTFWERCTQRVCTFGRCAHPIWQGDISFPSPPHGSILHGGSSRHIRAAHGGPSSSSAVNSSWIGTANLRVAVHCFASARRSARRLDCASSGRVWTRPRLRECLLAAGRAVDFRGRAVLRVPSNRGGDRPWVSLIVAPIILVSLVVCSCLPAGLGRPQASALGSRP